MYYAIENIVKLKKKKLSIILKKANLINNNYIVTIKLNWYNIGHRIISIFIIFLNLSDVPTINLYYIMICSLPTY